MLCATHGVMILCEFQQVFEPMLLSHGALINLLGPLCVE